MATNISFASNSLQTTNIITNNIDHFSIPTKDARLYALAHANQGRIPFVSYPSKGIRVNGTLADTSIPLLDTRIDTFKGYFINQDQNLDIDYAGSTRRYVATVNTLDIKRPGGLLYANFEIEFICTKPFGQNTSTTTALNAVGRTTSSSTDAYTFLGTAPYQLPIVTLTYSALTGGTSKRVNFGNNANGQWITIDRTFTAGDVIVIDCTLKTVTVNGTAFDFAGAFPEFAPGAQTFYYADTLSTRTFTYNIVYYPSYL